MEKGHWIQVNFHLEALLLCSAQATSTREYNVKIIWIIQINIT